MPPFPAGLIQKRTKKTSRVDGPWRGPIFSLVQAGFRMSESTERQVESLAYMSVASGDPCLVVSQSAGDGMGTFDDEGGLIEDKFPLG